jgi:hypothetical protein
LPGESVPRWAGGIVARESSVVVVVVASAWVSLEFVVEGAAAVLAGAVAAAYPVRATTPAMLVAPAMRRAR